jgi:hypothetical protein
MTLVSAAKCLTQGKAIGVDNFSQFDPNGVNKQIVEKRVTEAGLQNVILIDEDFEAVLWNTTQHLGTTKAGLYFIDGPHDYRSQLLCLLTADAFLHDKGVIVIDDANYAHVRVATEDFLKCHPEFTVLFEAYTKAHPDNLNEADRNEARRGWWNGVQILVRDPLRILKAAHSGENSDLRCFSNDHLVHSARLGILAPSAVGFFDNLLSGRLISAGGGFLRMIVRGVRHKRSGGGGKFKSLNTHSDGLAERSLASFSNDLTDEKRPPESTK